MHVWFKTVTEGTIMTSPVRKGYFVWASKRKVLWKPTLKAARDIGRNLAIECGRSVFWVENLGMKCRPISSYVVPRE